MGWYASQKQRNADHRAQKSVDRKKREQHKVEAAEEKKNLQDWRERHPLEKNLNRLALGHFWPKAKMGEAPNLGSLAGAEAELFNAGAHKGWTASRVAGNAVGVASLGTVPLFAGRKNKGAAAINIRTADGMHHTFTVKAEHLSQANRYVVAFNSYASELAR